MDFSRNRDGRFSYEHADRLPVIVYTAGKPTIFSTGEPIVIEPGCRPALSAMSVIRTIVIDGEPVSVLMEIEPVNFGGLSGASVRIGPVSQSVSRPPRRSIWDVYGLRRKPRVSRGR